MRHPPWALAAPAALCAGLLSGCFSPPDGGEILVSTTPPGASCTLSRLGQPIATAEPTPAIVLVEPSGSDITVLCRRQGFADAAVTLPARERWLSFGLLYGRSPFDYQPRVEIAMTPKPPGAPR